MSELLSFVGSLAGAYEGPLTFDLNGEVTELTTADEITAHEGQLYIQALQSDGRVPFVWGVMAEASGDDWQGCQVEPTAVLEKDGTLLLFWAFDVPYPAEMIQQYAERFESALDEAIPTPGANGWTLNHLNPEVFYTEAEFERVYGDPGPSDGAIYAAVSRQNVPDEVIEQIIEEARAEIAAEQDAPPWEDETYADAIVKAPYDESDPDLLEPIIVSFGSGRDSRKWKPQEMPVGGLVALLCQHKAGPKDGMAIVQGDMVPGDRKAVAIKSLSVCGLDIDVGIPGAVIDEELKKLGCLAVRYTTHSHMKTRTEFNKDAVARWAKDNEKDLDDPTTIQLFVGSKGWTHDIASTAIYAGDDHTERGIMAIVEHDPMPKHRVIVFFKDPFVIAEEGETQKAAMEKWKLVPKALAYRLGDLPLDKTGVDPSRLFYLPRHDKNASFEISLFGGPRLDWRTLELTNKLDDALAQAVAGDTKHKSKSTTQEGRDLGRWMKGNGEGFQVVDVLRDHAPERIRADVSNGVEIECPFDDHHSNPGDPDDRACMAVNAGEGTTNIFTVTCRHESCLDRTPTDMVGKMVKDAWFAAEVLNDETYNAIAMEDRPEEQQQAAKVEIARAEYEVLIEALSDQSSDEEIEAAIGAVIAAEIKGVGLTRLQERVKTKTKMTLASVKKSFTDVRKSATPTAKTDENGQIVYEHDNKHRLVFRYSNDYDFPDAAQAAAEALRGMNKKLPMVAHVDGQAVYLAHTKSGRTIFKQHTARSLWAELNNRMVFARVVEGQIVARGAVPNEIGNYVFERCGDFMPPAPEIVATPLYVSGPKGEPRLITEPGWYKKEGILMAELDFEAPLVPEAPTAEEVEAALDLLLTDVLGDFPFADNDEAGAAQRDPSQANALAMILTPFMRRIITGHTPVFFVSKPTPGTGGTFLAKVPMILFDGSEGAPMVYTENQDEMSKALLASAMDARSFMFFDDVASFNSRVIMRAMTSSHIGGRVLGGSTTIEIANNFIWSATGNNPDVKPEMERRVCWIRLFRSKEEQEKYVFKHKDHHEWLRNQRTEVVGAILTLIQYWISCDMPLYDERKLASFEDWSRRVGGVLQCVGIEGFLNNKKPPAADMNEAARYEFVQQWWARYSGEHVNANQLWDLAQSFGSDLIEGREDDARVKRRFFSSVDSIENRNFVLEDDIDVQVVKTVVGRQPMYFLRIREG